MRLWAWAGALLGLLAGVVLAAPAPWLAAGVARATDGRVQLLGARGSLWEGQAQLVLRDGPGGRSAAALPTPLAWRLQPRSWGLQLELSSACCTPQPLRVDLDRPGAPWRLALADGASRWPAELLAGLGAPWNTVGLQGPLQLRTQGLSVEWSASSWRLRGSAVLEAADLAASLSTLRPLGSYRVRADGGADGRVALQLETLSGALRIAGAGQWDGSRLQGQGEATAEAGSEEALGPLLNLLGRRDGARSRMSLN